VDILNNPTLEVLNFSNVLTDVVEDQAKSALAVAQDAVKAQKR
jgi:hypothetical protein